MKFHQASLQEKLNSSLLSTKAIQDIIDLNTRGSCTTRALRQIEQHRD